MYPTLFKIGPLTIHTYGVIIAIAFFTGFYLLYKEAVSKAYYPEKILDLELVILVSGIIGARLLHVVVNPHFYSANPFDVFFIWQGGLAVYGGLIIAIVSSWVFILKNRMPLQKTADLVIPYIALGQSIGRIGCLFNGCCYGKYVTSSCPGIIFPPDTVPRYPTQVYASLALLLIFVILKIFGGRPRIQGSVFTLYLFLYGGQRFLIDFLRGDNPTYILGLTVSQVISIFMIVAAFVLFLWCKKRGVYERD